MLRRFSAISADRGSFPSLVEAGALLGIVQDKSTDGWKMRHLRGTDMVRYTPDNQGAHPEYMGYMEWTVCSVRFLLGGKKHCLQMGPSQGSRR
jgi:hypothetical protein